ncbi:uncharacterized protein LOC112638881 [Camponotus floridanus]|uniref:uncharacterized protein LOC112638881 n=1 Tax=Camponotus floridanus TaxID=104421 RepID=UPI000DC69332|nr:uncharacterized protein LOC112638881 [Camponotus floridanus]
MPKSPGDILQASSLSEASLLAPDSWVQIVEGEETNSIAPINAEDDDGPSARVASKRKKKWISRTNLRPRVPKKRIPADVLDLKTTSKDCEILTCFNPESAKSGTERDERRGKVGRPRRKPKAIDPIRAEQEILKQTGLAPENIGDEVLNAMTPSEIGAQALEYTASIEMIRTKCGKIQGGLSGELRKRLCGLEELIRALQVQAEATGDPLTLQAKIGELLEEMREIKKERDREEERRKREYSELQERIQELKKEREEIRRENREIKRANSELRDEIRGMNDRLKRELTQIRESIDRESEKRISPRFSKAAPSVSSRLDRNSSTLSNLKKGNLSTKREDIFTRKENVFTRKEDVFTKKEDVFTKKEKENLFTKEEDLSTNEDNLFKETPKPQRPSPGRPSPGRPIEMRTDDPQYCRQWPTTGESWSPASKKRKVSFAFGDNREIESLPSTSKDTLSTEPVPMETETRPTVKKGIKLKGNVQIIPPGGPRLPWPESYAKVLQKYKSPMDSDKLRPQLPGQAPQPQEWFTIGKKGKPVRTETQQKTKKILREKKRIPKTATISIKGCKEEFSYAEALQKVRANISLKDLDIQNPRIRKGISGITIIEISGPENEEKANRLANEMQKMLAREALISRPCIKGELKLSGLDESITTDEIRRTVALKDLVKRAQLNWVK